MRQPRKNGLKGSDASSDIWSSIPLLTDDDVLAARLPTNIKAKLFANRELSEGCMVAVRLNLNGEVKKDNRRYALQSVHRGVSWRGRVIGYDRLVTVTQAAFMVGQSDRAKIAEGGRKFPMAAVVGALRHGGSLDGVEVRFNPRTSHLFVRADDGRPVRSADEVTVFNTRAYARGQITYWSEAEAPEAASGLPSDARFVPHCDE